MNFISGKFKVNASTIEGIIDENDYHVLIWCNQLVSSTYKLIENINLNQLYEFNFNIDNVEKITDIPKDFYIHFTIYRDIKIKGKLYKNDFGVSSFKVFDLNDRKKEQKLKSFIKLPNVIGFRQEDKNGNDVSELIDGIRGVITIKNININDSVTFIESKYDYDISNAKLIDNVYKEFVTNRSNFINKFGSTIPNYKLVLPNFRFGSEFMLPGSYYLATRFREKISESKLLNIFNYNLFMNFKDMYHYNKIDENYYNKFTESNRDVQIKIIADFLTTLRVKYLGDKVNYIHKKANCYKKDFENIDDLNLIKLKNCFEIDELSMEHFSMDQIIKETSDCEDSGKLSIDLAYYMKTNKFNNPILTLISNILKDYLCCLAIMIVSGASVEEAETVTYGGHAIGLLIPINYFNRLSTIKYENLKQITTQDNLKPIILEGTGDILGLPIFDKKKYDEEIEFLKNNRDIFNNRNLNFKLQRPLYSSESNFYIAFQEIVPMEFADKYDQSELLLLKKLNSSQKTIGILYEDFINGYNDENIYNKYEIQLLPDYTEDQINFFEKLLLNTTPILSYDSFQMDYPLKLDIGKLKLFLNNYRDILISFKSSSKQKSDFDLVPIYLDFRNINFNTFDRSFDDMIKKNIITDFSFNIIHVTKNTGSVGFILKRKKK